ncbi:MAG: DUF2949 domain-containing protein [Leptolyngbyaceae bacterium]|nr:DUF2949 domain-containing protein [Leptolyngbyaceae bacterium]
MFKMKNQEYQFLQFLRNDIILPEESISLALRHHHNDWSLLPITLWMYGLASIDQLDCMFDWLERR